MINLHYVLLLVSFMLNHCASGSNHNQCDNNRNGEFYEIFKEINPVCNPRSSEGWPRSLRKPLNDQSNMALVVYTPTLLSAFRQEMKTFTFAGRSVTIQQKWEELGVAAVVWDAAVVLAEYLEKSVNEQQFTLRGKSVIELGAGTGLAGIVAALLGGDVALTDRNVALDQLQANMEANVPGIGVRSGITASVKELSWGENLQEFPSPFDLVIGADIVYLEDTFPKLLQTLVHLTNKDSLVLLSCRIRYSRDEKFLDMLRKQFSVKEVLHDKSRDIHVYEAKLL